jgi:cystathionine beta-synthase
MGGVGRYLKERKPEVQLVGVDPIGSLYYDYIKTQRIAKPFTYKVEGIGEDFFPGTFDPKLIDDIVRVDDKECFLMTRELVRTEGLFCGGSSGAAVSGALQYARKTGKKQNIVVLLPDGAAKYLSKIFNDEWMREHGLLDDLSGLGFVADLQRQKPRGDVVTADAFDRVKEVIAKLKDHGISQLPVTKEGKLIGVVTEVGLLRYLATGEYSLASTIEALAESDYATVSSNTSIEAVRNLLGQTRIAIVTDNDQVVGVITKIDMIDYLTRIRGRNGSIVPPKA